MTAIDIPATAEPAPPDPGRSRRRRRVLFVVLWAAGLLLVAVLAGAAALVARVATVQAQLRDLPELLEQFQASAADADADGMRATLDTIGEHMHAAREAASDPLWHIAEFSPLYGADLRAVREAVEVGDDLVTAVGRPLAAIVDDVAPAALFVDGRLDLDRVQTVSRVVSSVTDPAIGLGRRAEAISTAGATPDVADAVGQLKAAVAKAVTLVTDAGKAATLAHAMMGGSGPRTYLVLIMNNAELRAQGGMPGFTAAVRVQDGGIRLLRTASTTDFDPIPADPVSATTDWEDALYSSDVARRLQDVTATHDFRDTARYAIALAKPIYGTTFDAVLALDPYVLSYILGATGPVRLADGSSLTPDNAVRSLLGDVYLDHPEPAEQDAYFGGVVDSLMGSLSAGSFDPAPLLAGLSRSVDEDRIRLWSATEDEQRVIATTDLDGVLPGGEHGPVIGVYANDWTRSKMDFYLDARAAVVDGGCRAGQHTATVTVTLRHTLTADRASRLPEYVTGDGRRVARGDIATQVVVVGPVGSQVTAVEGAVSDRDAKTVRDAGGRPATTRTIVLRPGQTGTMSATLSWPDDGRALADVVHTPQIALSGDAPSTSGCR